MASSSVVNIQNNTIPKHDAKNKAAAHALQHSKIQNEREKKVIIPDLLFEIEMFLQVAEHEMRREEMKTAENRRKYHDVEKQRNIAEVERDDYIAKVHDQEVVQENLKREIERERRDHEREMEEVKREFQREIDMRKLELRWELDDERLKAREGRKKFENKIEEVTEEISELNNKIYEVDEDIKAENQREIQNVVQDNLKREFVRERRDHEREMEDLKREYQREIDLKKLEYNKELVNERLKAREERLKLEEEIEEATEEIEELRRRDEIKMEADQTNDKEKKVPSSSLSVIHNSRVIQNSPVIIINNSRKGEDIEAIMREYLDKEKVGHEKELDGERLKAKEEREKLESKTEESDQTKEILIEIRVVPQNVNVDCRVIKAE